MSTSRWRLQELSRRDRPKDAGTDKLALKTIMPAAIHASLDLNKTDCTTCHGEGKAAPSFKKIHSGYDKQIYTADGLKYSTAITFTIDSAALTGNKLDIKFSAVESAKLKVLESATITPTVLVGLYGYDTKDYIVGPHERLTDRQQGRRNRRKDERALSMRSAPSTALHDRLDRRQQMGSHCRPVGVGRTDHRQDRQAGGNRRPCRLSWAPTRS